MGRTVYNCVNVDLEGGSEAGEWGDVELEEGGGDRGCGGRGSGDEGVASCGVRAILSAEAGWIYGRGYAKGDTGSHA